MYKMKNKHTTKKLAYKISISFNGKEMIFLTKLISKDENRTHELKKIHVNTITFQNRK